MIDLFRPAAPSRPARRDWFAPALIAGSLLLHVGIVAPLLFAPEAEAARGPSEIPVEVVQLPPEPDHAKPVAPKPVAPKPLAPKPVTPQPPAPRPQAQKPPERPRPPSTAERMERLIGPMPAMAMPALAGGDNPFDDPVSYRQLVLSKVARQKREERHDGIPGHAVIAFAVGDRGEVVSCEVREKSADPSLDAEAVAMVYRGAPYPPPPPGAHRDFTFGLAFHTL